METSTGGQQTYILAYIFPQMDSEALSRAHSTLVKIVEDNGARVVQSRMPIMRQLAYPMQKHMSGFTGEIEFWSDTATLPALTEALKEVALLRSMIIKKQTVPARKPSKREKVAAQAPLATPRAGIAEREKERATSKEKIGIDDIDKRLEEIMDNVGDS